MCPREMALFTPVWAKTQHLGRLNEIYRVAEKTAMRLPWQTLSQSASILTKIDLVGQDVEFFISCPRGLSHNICAARWRPRNSVARRKVVFVRHLNRSRRVAGKSPTRLPAQTLARSTGLLAPAELNATQTRLLFSGGHPSVRPPVKSTDVRLFWCGCYARGHGKRFHFLERGEGLEAGRENGASMPSKSGLVSRQPR